MPCQEGEPTCGDLSGVHATGAAHCLLSRAETGRKPRFSGLTLQVGSRYSASLIPPRASSVERDPRAPLGHDYTQAAM